MRPLDEQVVLITGATDGLGRGVAEQVARRGATVLLHGRDDARGARAIDEIKAATGNDRLRWYRADFASLDEVRATAAQVLDAERRLDVLVNNAGIGATDDIRMESRDGYELRFQVNYLAPYLLTRLLQPLVERSAPARIVNVASAGQAALDFDDVMLERRYDPWTAYRQSKLAQVLFTFDLADELAAHAVTVNALHPGTFMPTKMVTDARINPVTPLESGIEATTRLAIDPAVDDLTGRFFDGTREARADPQAYDDKARRRLRELSDQLTGL
jgi:NAD(P)-dependent dehydrogenase (short-subunit alcohol dehydrogenase family)